MEAWSVHQLYSEAASKHGQDVARELKNYAENLRQKKLPVIFTLNHLAIITRSNYNYIRKTVSRKRESANYNIFRISKRSGGYRYIHAVCGKLLHIQRFINRNILQRIDPHNCSFAFHKNGGIRACAAVHCGAKYLFQYDLLDFFYSINEVDVYKVFLGMGYCSLLSFELARLCTTIHLASQNENWLIESKPHVSVLAPYSSHGYLGVLPQGAPTSPALSNLVAQRLDEKLCEFARKNDLVYTRYADDITLSCVQRQNKYFNSYVNRKIKFIIWQSGFTLNDKKTRIAGPGSRKLVLGLLVDGSEPRVSKATYKRIERHLYAISKFGLSAVAEYEKFNSVYGYYNHLVGLLAFVKDVDRERWKNFRVILDRIEPPWQNLDV